MKKVLYGLLLLVEAVAALMILSLLWNNTFYLAVAAIAVIWAALIAWVLIKLKKADDEALKRKLFRLICSGNLLLLIMKVC